MGYYGWSVVDVFVDDRIAKGYTQFDADDLARWMRAHSDPDVKVWSGQASYILQQHRNMQQFSGPHNGMATRHRVKCMRKGPWAPWMIEGPGSWDRAVITNWADKMRAGFVDDACCALPMAKQEDANNGHVKVKKTDADGPALRACKKKITALGYSVNAALAMAGAYPIDVAGMLARY
jgi:hypothetical protein